MTHSQQRNLFGSDADAQVMPWEAAAAADRLAAQVVFDRPLETAYSYLVPDELRAMIAPGQRVRVPLGRGNRPTVGYVVALGPPPETSRSLKPVHELIDREPLVGPQMLELTRWIADRYLCGWGQVLDCVVPAGVKKKAGTRIVTSFQPAPDVCRRVDELDLPQKQRAVLDVLCSSGQPLRASELTEAAGCGTSPVQALREKGLIQAARERSLQFAADLEPAEKISDLELNRDQQLALQTILAHLRSGRHRTVLLHGVTGSGKTEVYIQAIREVVGYGRQAIVLVPEISLTPQTIRRFRSRFDSVAVLHSHLSDSERHWHWQQIARGRVQVVVGARSAVFAPTPHPGIIIIDEEHETSFKQETTPRYHAREVARKRAEMENIPLVLGSATPTLESWRRIQQSEDTCISMPKRVEGRPLPPVVIVDVRNDRHISRGRAVGQALESAMRRALEDGGQVILLLNLRGFAPTLWCRACGESVRCPHCEITLTWHKDRNRAVCHVCDFEAPPPRECPRCGKPGLRYFGIGTQRLEEEIRARFPEHTCQRMDSDSMRKPGSHDLALEAFRRGEVQILLGTQMIAKGLDFPNVTLVGVVDADTMLHQPDFRSSERTFQLLAQVSGRTGRSDRGGRVFVQTSSPMEPAIRKAAEHDYAGFVEQELDNRRESYMPPFVHLARVILRGESEADVRDQADRLAEGLQTTMEASDAEVRLLGPAPAPIARLKKNYRYHLQLAAEDVGTILDLWRRATGSLSDSSGVECAIDVDPLDMR